MAKNEIIQQVIYGLFSLLSNNAIKKKRLRLTFSLGHWSEVPLVTKDTSGAPKQYNWLNDIKIIRP